MSLQTFAAWQYQTSILKIQIYLKEGRVLYSIMLISSVMSLVLPWELPL